MARVRFRAFGSGWWPMGAPEAMPPGTLRRSTGTHPVKTHLLRSRFGSSLVFNLTAHSVYRFAGGRFAGGGTQFYLNGLSIKTGLNGNRLAFMRMPPTSGVADQLFVAGGGSLFKVDATGLVTNWGIAAPLADFTVTDAAVGVMGAGTYRYAITFRNSTTGSRSNSNPNQQSVTIAINRQISLANIPVSPDTQVNAREVWRTNAGGTVLFFLATISDNTTTTYADNTPDAGLSAIQLPTDNAPPNANYNDVAGPYYGRALWGRVTITGRKGQVPYSPPGRPESDVGFILVSSDDDPVQKVVLWGGSAWAITQAKFYQILGTDEPFTFREIQGAPGTTNPFTVKPTPYGIMYQASDGIYLMNGANARLIGYDAVGLLFRGESLEGVSFGAGIAADFIRNEYFISDGTTTLAINPATGTWRNVGVGLNAVYGEPDTLKILAAIGTSVALLEEAGIFTDVGANIAFEVETMSALTDVAQLGVIQRLYIETNTNGQWLVPRIIVDGVATVLPQIQTTGRVTVELPVNLSGRLISVRLTGSLTNQVEVYGIEADDYVGTQGIVPTPVAGSSKTIVPMGAAL